MQNVAKVNSSENLGYYKLVSPWQQLSIEYGRWYCLREELEVI